MEATSQCFYIYLQPLSISARHCKGGKIFAGQNCLQIDGPKIPSTVSGKNPIKVRDLIKYNKDYKVYNSNIHFFNFLYVIQINFSTLSQLSSNTIKMRLLTKGAKNHPRVRSYCLQLDSLFGTQNQSCFNVETQIFDEIGDQKSQLACNIIKSNTTISLRVLQEVLQEQKSIIFNQSSNLDSTDNEFSIVLKSVKDQLQTVDSNQDYDEILKQQSCLKSMKDSEMKVQNLSMMSKDENLTEVDSRFWKDESPVRRQTCDSNTLFLQQSPKMKRLLRMRRSLIRANSISSNWSEEEIPLEQTQKQKDRFKNILSYIIILAGTYVIYILMQPSCRL